MKEFSFVILFFFSDTLLSIQIKMTEPNEYENFSCWNLIVEIMLLNQQI